MPFVYALHSDARETTRSLRQIECTLDEWETNLPSAIRLPRPSDSNTVNGTGNLHFCLLSIKLLLCRIAFKTTLAGSGAVVAEEKPFRLGMLREAAFALIDFVTALTPAQLGEFWLPYTAHLLVTAATITLRCLLESTDLSTKRTCALKLVNFKDRLVVASKGHSWDLADFCLERCSEPIDKILDAMGVVSQPARSSSALPESDASAQKEPVESHFDLDDMAADLFFPVDSLDYPFDALWSMPL